MRIQVPNPDRLMRIGMFATATFHGRNLQDHAAVPASAILHLHDRDWVYVPAGDGKFKRVGVVGGDMLPGGKQEVTSGLAAGQQVVTNALELQNYGGAVMIRGLVDFALNNRFMILALAILLFVWGAISFHNLPVEAYPDVANNYVEVITQWPGRAAEEVEQQVTIPIEIQMAGIPHMQHLRSFSLAGLSDVKMIFDDDSVNDWNREKVLERLSQVTLPASLQPQMGTDWSPVGQIYWYTLHSTNPAYDNMELKSLEDWTLEKQFKSVPGVVDVASFGGMTREYQVRVDPNKLIAYGLSIGQVEQQLANNNINAGGSFIEEGQQQINVREVGLYRNVQDIEQTVLKTQNGTALRVKDIATGRAGPEDPAGPDRQGDPSGRRQDHRRRRCGRGHRAAAEGRRFRLDAGGHSRKSQRAEQSDSAAGRQGCSVPGPQRPVALHHAYGSAQSDRGHHPGRDHSLSLPGECSRRAHRLAHHSVLAAVCLHLP